MNEWLFRVVPVFLDRESGVWRPTCLLPSAWRLSWALSAVDRAPGAAQRSTPLGTVAVSCCKQCGGRW